MFQTAKTVARRRFLVVFVPVEERVPSPIRTAKRTNFCIQKEIDLYAYTRRNGEFVPTSEFPDTIIISVRIETVVLGIIDDKIYSEGLSVRDPHRFRPIFQF